MLLFVHCIDIMLLSTSLGFICITYSIFISLFLFMCCCILHSFLYNACLSLLINITYLLNFLLLWTFMNLLDMSYLLCHCSVHAVAERLLVQVLINCDYCFRGLKLQLAYRPVSSSRVSVRTQEDAITCGWVGRSQFMSAE